MSHAVDLITDPTAAKGANHVPQDAGRPATPPPLDPIAPANIAKMAQVMLVAASHRIAGVPPAPARQPFSPPQPSLLGPIVGGEATTAAIGVTGATDPYRFDRKGALASPLT